MMPLTGGSIRLLTPSIAERTDRRVVDLPRGAVHTSCSWTDRMGYAEVRCSLRDGFQEDGVAAETLSRRHS